MAAPPDGLRDDVDVDAPPGWVGDERLAGFREMDRIRAALELGRAAEHVRRLADQPAEVEAVRSRAEAEERAQRLALIPRSDALVFARIEPHPQQQAQNAAELERLGRQMAADTITRRAVLLAYDLPPTA